VVVDERCEIGAVSDGIPQNNLGLCCDILSGYPKGEGILTAVRTLSPQVIICDEIGAQDEVTGMLDGLRCGVKIIASAHAQTLDELLCKKQIVRLLGEDAFAGIFMLESADRPCKIGETAWMEALHYENGRYTVNRPVFYHDGNSNGVEYVG
jgi:stage III sporulation protein AA